VTRERLVKMTQAPDYRVGLTASLETGRYVVELRPDNGWDDGTIMTPAQARNLARALDAYAAIADKAQARLREAK